MRTHGTLIRWNDDRGFGFIKTAKSDGELFVHVSSFPRDGRRPQLNELVSFEIESGPDGRKRAVRVMRPGQTERPPAATARRTSSSRSSRFAASIATVAVFSLAVYAYDRFERGQEQASFVEQFTPPAESHHQCDGRTMCSQMTSCSEATYFLQNCPGPQMDGDGDGVPCETQWCN